MTMSNINYNDNMNFPIEGIPSNAVSIVGSVADEEYSIASLLEAQSNLLCNAINHCITVCDFIDIIQSIIRTLKTIIQKNNILENKLRETLNFIQKEGIGCLDYNEQFELLNNLNSVLESIGTEESSLGYLIDKLGKGVTNIASYCTFDDIKQVNNLVITLMKLIVEKNMILLRKLRTVISLIKFIKDSEFDIFIKIKKEMFCTIKKLINSIFKEEKGLAELIFGESVKMSCALKMCINEEELSELDSLITSFIDVICDKKRILEYKLSEILTLLNTVGFSSCEIDSIMNHLKDLQSVAYIGEFELSKLIKNNSKELNKFIDKECCNFNELISFNICITCNLVCLLLNLNSGRKNKNAFECDPGSCSNKSICKKINNIINQIK